MAGQDSFVAEAFTLLCISVLIVGLRTYVRFKQVGVRNFQADDYLMLLALVPYAAETALAYTVGAKFHGLTNTGMTEAERKALSPDSEEYRLRVDGSKIQIAGWIIYSSLLWTIKAALCAFYLRLTDGLQGYRTRIYIGYGLVVATYIAILFCVLCSCQPFHHLWQIYPNPGNVCQPAISKLYIIVIVVLNIATDIYLLAIPLPMLWTARIPKVKKYGLVVLFSGAIFVMIAGLLRCFLIINNPETGPQQAASWAVRESFVAVVTSNLPSTYGWMRQKLRPIFGSLLSSNDDSKYKVGPEPGSIMLRDAQDLGWRTRNGRSAPSRAGHGALNDPTERDVYIHGGGEASSDEIIPPNQDGIKKDVEVTVHESWPRR
ncbi:hypothetical protein FSPOR_6783 [Fusarium sporotrichioides]|uniref:Rhodopsin domain-containing protein n=1 Tax=Fusarium sporotrichioides TaxID=5514 RepID=A0A395S178_FUSSP|nr:hypothetical protein FSPOR_6783 [Fusarium sporotrichioides]